MSSFWDSLASVSQQLSSSIEQAVDQASTLVQSIHLDVSNSSIVLIIQQIT